MKTITRLLSTLAFSLCASAAQAEVVTLAPMTFPGSASPQQWNFASTAQNDILFDFKLSFTGTLERNDFAVLYLGNSDGPNIGLKTNCDSLTCTNDLFVRTKNGPAPAIAYADPSDIGPFPSPETHHLFGRLYKSVATGNYDRFALWYNPTAQDMATLTNPDALATGDSGFKTFSTFGLRTANINNNVTVNMSDIRITAVPEPGTLALLGVAGFGMAGLRRRRQGQAA